MPLEGSLSNVWRKMTTGAAASVDGPPAKNKRGSSGLPRGVIKTNSGKFQGRVNYKPGGVKRGSLRGVGTFDTAEDAGRAVADAEAKLEVEGPEAVWTELARANQHKRGEVRPATSTCPPPTPPAMHRALPTNAHLQAPPPERLTARRLGVYSTKSSAKLHLSATDFEVWQAENCNAGVETNPTYGIMPSTIEKVRNQSMAAFLASDGSAEVAPAAMIE